MNQLTIELPIDVPVEEARILVLSRLFEAGLLSLGQAARLAGYSKATFIELLGKRGVAIVRYPVEELAQELLF